MISKNQKNVVMLCSKKIGLECLKILHANQENFSYKILGVLTNERRNEILANGEYWEKQLVEETFWKDYGGELLEILQDAAETSPA